MIFPPVPPAVPSGALVDVPATPNVPFAFVAVFSEKMQLLTINWPEFKIAPPFPPNPCRNCKFASVNTQFVCTTNNRVAPLASRITLFVPPSIIVFCVICSVCCDVLYWITVFPPKLVATPEANAAVKPA